jgi:NAD(P)-dependent dehydrogenase (short-subunit alcohol dehydrogenase family)
LPRQSYLVTGATGGLGAIVCERLAASGARVIATCRSRERLHALAAKLDGAIEVNVADLASLAEVDRLAREVGPIDVLVNNAGVGFGRDQLRRELSHDGIELRLAVNYLAPFVLTYALIERARAVVQVASVGQRELDFSNFELERDYDGIVAYRRSKLAQVMLAFDTAARFATPTTALHPGTFLDTGMVAESGITPLGTAVQGADAILDVTAKTLAGTTGEFFDQHRLASAHPQAYDKRVRRELFARSCELVQRFIEVPSAARGLL